MTLLTVQNASISIKDTQKKLVDDISFRLDKGKVLCLVGESGSGKTLSALSVIGLLPEALGLSEGVIKLDGQDLAQLTEKDWRKVRGQKIGMIFQEPMTSLNPVFKVGKQVAEVFEIHTKLSKKDIQKKVLDLFRKVKIDNPERRYHEYPHQLSGGQRQRVMIAMALALEPKLFNIQKKIIHE